MNNFILNGEPLNTYKYYLEIADGEGYRLYKDIGDSSPFNILKDSQDYETVKNNLDLLEPYINTNFTEKDKRVDEDGKVRISENQFTAEDVDQRQISEQNGTYGM